MREVSTLKIITLHHQCVPCQESRRRNDVEDANTFPVGRWHERDQLTPNESVIRDRVIGVDAILFQKVDISILKSKNHESHNNNTPSTSIVSSLLLASTHHPLSHRITETMLLSTAAARTLFRSTVTKKAILLPIANVSCCTDTSLLN